MWNVANIEKKLVSFRYKSPPIRHKQFATAIVTKFQRAQNEETLEASWPVARRFWAKLLFPGLAS